MGRTRFYAWGPMTTAERVGTWIGRLLVIFGMVIPGLYFMYWVIRY